jgi:hypothetical protein
MIRLLKRLRYLLGNAGKITLCPVYEDNEKKVSAAYRK